MLLTRIIEILNQHKAKDIQSLEVKHLTPLMDNIVICTATSNRQAQTLSEILIRDAKKRHSPVLGVEGKSIGEWILVDLEHTVIHIMLPAQRAFYQLEKLWLISAQ